MHCHDSEIVGEYFDKKYPERDKRATSLLFRRGEKSRISSVKRMIQTTEAMSVLDIGCSDGYLLSQILDGRPSLISLVDLSEKNIKAVERRLSFSADKIVTYSCDFRAMDIVNPYDIVIAIGVLDYYPDWIESVTLLLNATKGILVFDLPKSGTGHSMLRKLWLRHNGIKVFPITKRELTEKLEKFESPSEIIELPLNFLVGISVDNPFRLV